jgi:hypothetical protein
VNINNLFYQDIFTQIGRKFNLIGEGEVNNIPDNEREIPGDIGIKLDSNIKTEKKKKKCC